MVVGLEQFFLDNGRPVTRTTRVVRVLVALPLAAAPLVLCGVFVRRAAAVRRWPVVPCTVIDSGVSSDSDPSAARDHPYRVAVSFAFTIEGVPYVGNRLSASLAAGGTADAADAYAEADRYPVGSRRTCWADPAHPDEAVLVGPVPAWEPWVMPACWAAFAAVAVLYCVPQLRRAFAAADRPPAPPGPLRRRASAVLSGAALFVGFGSVTAVWFVTPVLRSLAARHWPAVPCVVEASHVQQHTAGAELPVTLYRTDVLYRYAVGGRTYRSNCYAPTECESPAAGGRLAVAAAYPAGRVTTCRVDPADPRSAALTTRVGPTLSFGVVPLTLALLGLLLMADAASGRVAGPVGRLIRRRPWSLATIGIVLAVWTAGGVFGVP